MRAARILLTGAILFFVFQYWIAPLIMWLWLMHFIGLLPSPFE